MDQEIETQQMSALSQELRDAYEKWAREYIGEDRESHLARLCEFAFAEGASSGGQIIKRYVKKVYEEQMSQFDP